MCRLKTTRRHKDGNMNISTTVETSLSTSALAQDFQNRLFQVFPGPYESFNEHELFL